jgi:hypothetical protein
LEVVAPEFDTALLVEGGISLIQEDDLLGQALYFLL